MKTLNSKALKTCISFFLIWILASAIGAYLRLYPLLTHRSFDASEKATLLVLSKLRQSVINSVNKEFPNATTEEKNKIIKRSFDNILSHESQVVRRTIDRISREMDVINAQGPSSYYLLASDSYYYFGLTKNIAKTGRISDTIKGSKYFNDLMLAPQGHWEPLNLHPYTGFFIYKFMKIFNPDVPLMYSVSYTPLVITILAVIPYLFICASFGCRALFSFTGAVLLLCSPLLLKRTMFGWYDNDPYSMLFPFTILALLFHILEHQISLKKRVFWACFLAFCITIYALFWHGWVYLLSNIFVGGIGCLLYNHFAAKEKDVTKNLLSFLGVIVAATFLFITVVFGVNEFFVLFQEGWTALQGFVAPQLTAWPDLYIGVGELYDASLKLLIHLTGNYFFFSVALLGLFSYVIQSHRKKQSVRIFKMSFILVFLLSSLLISLGAQRFAIFCIIPLSILFPIGLQFGVSQLDRLVKKYLKKEKFSTAIHYGISIIVCVAVLVPSLKLAYKNIPVLLNKIYNSAWEQSLTNIKENTAEESIVNTWWPPGHFVKSTAQRRVSFDGATINFPQAYWMSLVFLSQDERNAAGILRMLNNSANQAAEYLESKGVSLPDAIKTLRTITILNRNQAKIFLTSVLKDADIEGLLELTHNKPPPSYLLIYNDLVEKNIELKFVGSWNFQRIKEINEDPLLLSRVPKRNSSDYIKYLWKLSGGPFKYSDVLGQLSQQGNIVDFQQNVKMNIESKLTFVNSKKYGRGTPQSVFYIEGNKIVEKKFPKGNLPFSVLLYEEGATYSCILLDAPLANSLIMKLFFLDGKGLKYFKPFSKHTDLTRRTKIFVYEVDWEKFLDDLSAARYRTKEN